MLSGRWIHYAGVIALVCIWCGGPLGSVPAQESESTAKPLEDRSSVVHNAESNATGEKMEGTPVPEPGIVPPLSIYESTLLLKEAIQTLKTDTHYTTGARARLVDRTLRAVGAYVSQMDRAHPTLPYYTWERVSAEKISRAGWETQVLRPRRSMVNVTALALRVNNEDVEISRIVVIGREEMKWEFNRTIFLPAEQPRPEFCFLPLSTDVVELRVTCRRVNAERAHQPRLFIEAGQCSIRESAKAVVYYLQAARLDLKELRLSQAAGRVRQALVWLEEYRLSPRL